MFRQNIFPAIYSIQLLSHELKLNKSIENKTYRGVVLDCKSYSTNAFSKNLAYLKLFNKEIVDSLCVDDHYLIHYKLEIQNSGMSDYTPPNTEQIDTHGMSVELDITNIKCSWPIESTDLSN